MTEDDENRLDRIVERAGFGSDSGSPWKDYATVIDERDFLLGYIERLKQEMTLLREHGHRAHEHREE